MEMKGGFRICEEEKKKNKKQKEFEIKLE